MGYDELSQLLDAGGWQENESVSRQLATFILSCPSYHFGLPYLSQKLIDNDPLTCEQSRARFPTYYEATRPDYPLVKMADTALIQMAIHLGHCLSCQEEYKTLVLLSELEERDEFVDL